MEVLLDGIGPVPVATGFRQRLRGLRRSRPGARLLVAGWSVHGFGMDRPLLVIGLDRRMRVIGWRLLAPNRVALFPGASYVLEMPADARPPRPGTSLAVADG